MKGGEWAAGHVTGFEVNSSSAPNLLCKSGFVPRWLFHIPQEGEDTGLGDQERHACVSDSVAYFSARPSLTLEEMTTLRPGIQAPKVSFRHQSLASTTSLACDCWKGASPFATCFSLLLSLCSLLVQGGILKKYASQ